MKENRLVNAEYQEVAEAATQKYQEMQVELNSKMRDIVTVESIKKDRDERIAALRADVEKLERQMEDFRETEISGKVAYDKVFYELEQLKIDHQGLIDSLG